MLRIARTLGATVLPLVLFGCAKDGGSSGPCGAEGEHVTSAAGAYCVYIVVKGSFECPAGFPVEIRLGEGAVCAEESGDPSSLPPDVCELFEDGCGDPGDPVDASAADAASDAGSDVGPDATTEDATVLCDGTPMTLSIESVSGTGECPGSSDFAFDTAAWRLVDVSNDGESSIALTIDFCANFDEDCFCTVSLANLPGTLELFDGDVSVNGIVLKTDREWRLTLYASDSLRDVLLLHAHHLEGQVTMPVQASLAVLGGEILITQETEIAETCDAAEWKWTTTTRGVFSGDDGLTILTTDAIVEGGSEILAASGENYVVQVPWSRKIEGESGVHWFHEAMVSVH